MGAGTNSGNNNYCDNTSSQCLFFIKCFLSSFSRNIRIRSRSERLSRSRSLKEKSHNVHSRSLLMFPPSSRAQPGALGSHLNLRLSTSLISLSRCLCRSLSLCSLIWSNDRMSFLSLLDDLWSRLFGLWRKVSNQYLENKIWQKSWTWKGLTDRPAWNTIVSFSLKVMSCLLVLCFWFWRWWQALLWTCPWPQFFHFYLWKTPVNISKGLRPCNPTGIKHQISHLSHLFLLPRTCHPFHQIYKKWSNEHHKIWQ